MKQNKEILQYCLPHIKLMWAANIVSIILGCEFRDVTEDSIKRYINEN